MFESQVEERIFNETFKGDEPTNLNACVGNNGNPQQPEYAQGFIDASISLCKLVVEDDSNHLVDHYIYPIAFNMRHGVELWIKYFIQELSHIRKELVVDTVKLTATHDINILWKEFKKSAHAKDISFSVVTGKLDEYINNIGEIDPTAQTFRYPFSNESIKHLTQTPIINIRNLASRLVSMKTLLEELRSLIYSLIDDYNTGSYTSKLSRSQLLEIADELPPKELWHNDAFVYAKQAIKLKYNLSSNRDFNKAIDIIKVNYEMAFLINAPLTLKELTKEDLVKFLECWDVYHPHKEVNPLGTSIFDYSSRFVKADVKLEHAALISLKDSLSLESFADIAALYELGRFPLYSEKYPDWYTNQYDEIKSASRSDGDLLQFIQHYLNKTNFPRFLFLSLRLLKQDILISEIVKMSDSFEKEVASICSK
ncbi:hypothetical protein [Thalassotalea sp. ND16A]|uniref:hypothetical protein n=1 Tax=Thalassotalea sp. ND16A TaxID=1535422 RepID=UPI00051A0EFA|nr:hypothetical protein [Thalassotalea sp. ND16A]KGJ92085.1 hypothetical protein ND16A_1779 [Thalassotalea sp. ND16A]